MNTFKKVLLIILGVLCLSPVTLLVIGLLIAISSKLWMFVKNSTSIEVFTQLKTLAITGSIIFCILFLTILGTHLLGKVIKH
jgi:hypothetical protein